MARSGACHDAASTARCFILIGPSVQAATLANRYMWGRDKGIDLVAETFADQLQQVHRVKKGNTYLLNVGPSTVSLIR